MRVAEFLDQRLARGPLLLSGGFGTELERRGHPTPLPLWSAQVLADDPAAVQALHADYAAAGADVLTANTFRTRRASLAGSGLDARALTRQAVALARAAADAHGGKEPLLVAGSLGPVADCYRPDLVPDEATLRAEHGLHVGSLVAARADFVLIETMNTMREAEVALGAARAGLLPAMVSFVCGPDSRLLSGESLAAAVQAVEAYAPLAILVNCCRAEHASAALATLLATTARPVGVYANGSGAPDPDKGWRFDGGSSDAGYIDAAKAWLAAGARIVGGCCGTGPDVIRALREHLDA